MSNHLANGELNGTIHSTKYKIGDVLMYNYKKYVIYDIDKVNNRYGLMPITGDSDYVAMNWVDKDWKKTGGTHQYKQKRTNRKTQRKRRTYFF